MYFTRPETGIASTVSETPVKPKVGTRFSRNERFAVQRYKEAFVLVFEQFHHLKSDSVLGGY